MTHRSLYEVLHDFALSSGLGSEVIWDSFSPDQSDILRQKILTLIPETSQNHKVREKMRRDLFENVWLQRKYTNQTLLSSIVYVMVTAEKGEDAARQSTEFSCHPVFRTRKCLNQDNNSTGCCMIFIDEHARVYQNWKQFVAENVLPSGTMIAPANGVYTFSGEFNDQVNLECHPTPASLTKARVLNATDTVAGVGGLCATVPIAAALAFPVAAPVMLAATAVTVTTAAYTVLRSAMQLTDRRQHLQSTALTDRVARNSWFGVGSGVLGLGATGFTKAFTYAAAAGQEISLTTQLAVTGINATSTVLSGTGVLNNVYDIYMKINDDRSLSSTDMLQLASSMLVFTHSINNLNIVSTTGVVRGSSVRNELRNQMRNLFNRISRETVNQHSSSGHFDIIRTANDIPIMDGLMGLQKINSYLNGVGGGRVVNAVAGSLMATALRTSSAVEFDLRHLTEEFGISFVQHITNVNSLFDVMRAMAQNFCDATFRFLMNLAKIFIEENVMVIDRVLHTFLSTESVLHAILKHCLQKYSNLAYEFLESKTAEILNEIDRYFQSLNPINICDIPRSCGICRGKFYVSNL